MQRKETCPFVSALFLEAHFKKKKTNTTNLQVLLKLINQFHFNSLKRRSSLRGERCNVGTGDAVLFLTKWFKPGVKCSSELSPSRGSVTGMSLIKNAKREGCHLFS